MLGLDQDMEMKRMVMETLRRFDELQGSNGGCCPSVKRNLLGMEMLTMGRTMGVKTTSFQIRMQNRRQIMIKPCLNCSTKLVTHFMKGVPPTGLLPSYYSLI